MAHYLVGIVQKSYFLFMQLYLLINDLQCICKLVISHL